MELKNIKTQLIRFGAELFTGYTNNKIFYRFTYSENDYCLWNNQQNCNWESVNNRRIRYKLIRRRLRWAIF